MDAVLPTRFMVEQSEVYMVSSASVRGGFGAVRQAMYRGQLVAVEIVHCTTDESVSS
jgi:hypothetical protein